MKKSLVLLLAGAVLLLCSLKVNAQNVFLQQNPDDFLELWVPYDPDKPDQLNNLDERYIFIQDKDLYQIKKSQNPGNPNTDDPPVSFGVLSADYKAEIADGKVKIKGTYKINKLDNEWALIPIISKSAGLSSAMLGERPALMINKSQIKTNKNKFKNYNSANSGYHYLVLKNKGEYVLNIEFTEDIKDNPSQNLNKFTINMPKIPSVNIKCYIEKPDISFQIPEAASLFSEKTTSGTIINASLPPVNKINVMWRPESKIVDVADKKLPPSINAVTYSRIETGRGSLKGTFTADVSIRRSSMDKFKFHIPDDIEIDSIEAKGIDLVDPFPEINDGILAIELVSPVEGQIKFEIKYRKNFEDSSFTTKIPAITIVNKNIDRETGYVAALETTSIETSIVKAKNSINYREIDPKELKGDLSGINASIALKYIKTKDKAAEVPYDVTIKAVKYDDVSVYQASLESSNIISVLNRGGKMFTKAKLHIRNTGKQFFKVTLPKNSSIWSVYVDGKSVKPALKDQKNGIYAVPLIKSSASETLNKAFPVEIVYFTDNAVNSPFWLVEIVTLKALKSELMTNTIKWEIYVPDKIQYLPLKVFSNLLKEEKKHDKFQSGLFGKWRKLDKAAVNSFNDSLQMQVAPKMRSGAVNSRQEELIQTDSVYKRKNYKQVYKSKKIGKLPVYVNIPQVGQKHGFYQLSFEAGKFPSITGLYVNTLIINLLGLITGLIALYYVIKSIKANQYKSKEFVIPTLVLAILAFMQIGFYIILFALAGLIIAVFKKKIIKLPALPGKKTVIITGGLLTSIILMFLGFIIFPRLTYILIAILIGLGLVSFAGFVLYKTGVFIYKKASLGLKERHKEKETGMEGEN